jgi:hypothetical protein
MIYVLNNKRSFRLSHNMELLKCYSQNVCYEIAALGTADCTVQDNALLIDGNFACVYFEKKMS